MTNFTKKHRVLSAVSAIAMIAISGYGISQAQSAFTWGHGGDVAETDKRLSEAQIQIKYDGINAVPQLNVSATSGDVVVSRQDAVSFQTFWNYGAFIERAEVRIFSADESVRGRQIVALPVINGVATLPANTSLPKDVIYVLRVYGADGQFDETDAKLLTILDGPAPKSIDTVSGGKLAGYGIDRTATRNIRVKGGSVTVYGVNVADGGQVAVLGQPVPVDSHGQFAVQSILPFGLASIV